MIYNDINNIPKDKYSIIYADPPWMYPKRDNKKTKYGGGANAYYKPMKTKDICKLNVGGISSKNCALLLWCTFPKLKDGLEVMDAWGFRYVTLGFGWIKLNPKNIYLNKVILYLLLTCKLMANYFLMIAMNKALFFGTGYYTKSNLEVCLLGVRGKMKPISNKVSNIIISPLEEHSRKPDIARDKIVELFGDIPKIELFARATTEGWDVFGNEV